MEHEIAAPGGDPALLLAVQGAIAAANALTIYHRGERAAADRHEDALAVLNRLRDLPELSQSIAHFAKLLRVKGQVKYTGRSAKPDEVAALLEHARWFLDFVEKHLPPAR